MAVTSKEGGGMQGRRWNAWKAVELMEGIHGRQWNTWHTRYCDIQAETSQGELLLGSVIDARAE